MQGNTRLLRAKVWHLREKPKRNEFTYAVYYLAHKLGPQTSNKPALLSLDSFNVLSLYKKDLGAKNGKDWFPWIQETFLEKGITCEATDEIEVISHPRLFGYAFNPISFWLLLDSEGNIKAVLCEVHNTFGQKHNYVLAHSDGKYISPTDVFTEKKELYVSPFNTMDGYYTFSFLRTKEKFKADIIYYVEGEFVVKTAMAGRYTALNSFAILGVVVKYPLMTIRVILRIHWQAVKLFFKKVPLTLPLRPKNLK